MALQTKDYSVSGKSASGITYTFILRVTENSIDDETNSSNVTVQAILKKDYEAGSFTNVGISISCFLNAEQVIYDGRLHSYSGNDELLCETWTGNIVHADDGTHALTVSGKLWTSVTASFLPPTLTIAANEAEAMELTPIVSNTPPATPEGLTAPALVAAGSEFEISWNEAEDTEDNVSGYELEKSTDSGNSFELFYAGDNPEIWDEAPAEEDTVLCYRVRAVDADGAASEWSEMICVSVNSAPAFSDSAALQVFTDEACKIPAGRYSLGQTLYLQVSGWTDPDENMIGGQLLLQQRVKTPAGTQGQWEDLLTVDVGEAEQIVCSVKPEKAAYRGSVQYRATVTDTLGATCPAWIESAWLLRNDIPYARVAGAWFRPTVDSASTMPYVRVGGKWVRHGGLYQEQLAPDDTAAILGVGVLGAIILGKEV